jgi:hypothetical protein
MGHLNNASKPKWSLGGKTLIKPGFLQATCIRLV